MSGIASDREGESAFQPYASRTFDSCAIRSMTTTAEYGILVGDDGGVIRAVSVSEGRADLVASVGGGGPDWPGITALAVSGALLAVGDEEGGLRVWDLRTNAPPLLSERQHGDFIADVSFVHSPHRIITASGDGTVGVVSLSSRRYTAVSDSTGVDLTCAYLPVVTDAGTTAQSTIVTGTAGGSLLGWPTDPDVLDKPTVRLLSMSEESIECLAGVGDEATDVGHFLAGGEDGVIRMVARAPGALSVVGYVGTHDEGGVYALATKGDLAVSASDDCSIRFWDISTRPPMGTFPTPLSKASSRRQRAPVGTSPLSFSFGAPAGGAGQQQQQQQQKQKQAHHTKRLPNKQFFSGLM